MTNNHVFLTIQDDSAALHFIMKINRKTAASAI